MGKTSGLMGWSTVGLQPPICGAERHRDSVNGPTGPCAESCKLNCLMAESAVPEGSTITLPASRPRILQEQVGTHRHIHPHSAWSPVTFTMFAQPGPQVLTSRLFLSLLLSLPEEPHQQIVPWLSRTVSLLPKDYSKNID